MGHFFWHKLVEVIIMKFVNVFIGVLTCVVIGLILGEVLLQVLAFLSSVMIGAVLCSIACGVFHWSLLTVALFSGLIVGQSIGIGTASLGLIIGAMAIGAVAVFVIGNVNDREEGEEDDEDEEDFLNQVEN
jgi:hypothetical protein